MNLTIQTRYLVEPKEELIKLSHVANPKYWFYGSFCFDTPRGKDK